MSDEDKLTCLARANGWMVRYFKDYNPAQIMVIVDWLNIHWFDNATIALRRLVDNDDTDR